MRYCILLLLICSAWAGDKDKAAKDKADIAAAEAAVAAACASLEAIQVEAAKRGDVDTVAAAQAALVRVMPNGKVKDGDHNDDGHADNGNSKGGTGCACGATCTCGQAAPPVVDNTPKPAHVGRWKMVGHGDQTYVFKADGTCTATTNGTWVPAEAGKITATWENSYVDTFDPPCQGGSCMKGKNNYEDEIEVNKLGE